MLKITKKGAFIALAAAAAFVTGCHHTDTQSHEKASKQVHKHHKCGSKHKAHKCGGKHKANRCGGKDIKTDRHGHACQGRDTHKMQPVKKEPVEQGTQAQKAGSKNSCSGKNSCSS